MGPEVPLTLLGAPREVQVLAVGLVLIVLVMACCPLLLWLKRRLSRREAGGGSGFSIEELEEMRRSGRISTEEFRRLRSVLLGLQGAGAPKGESELSNSPGSDDEKAEPAAGDEADRREDIG